MSVQTFAGIRFGGFLLDRSAGGLFRLDDDGNRVPLPIGSRALDVLGVLVERQGELVSRQAIMDAVWPDTAVEENNLTVQISALRRVLDDGRAEGSCIQTVPGRGYRFVAAASKHAITSRAAPPRMSVAVLPLVAVDSGSGDEALATGVTEDLTTDLARVRLSLSVAPLDAVLAYKGTTVDARKMGEELDVCYVVKGSVRRLDQTVRVNIELISTETGSLLWADRLDNDTEQRAAQQEEIVRTIGQDLYRRLVTIEAERGGRERPDRPDALDLVLRAGAIKFQRRN